MHGTTPIILINGSKTIKTGFSGECAPRSVYPSIIGYKTQNETYIGEEAYSKRGILNTRNIFKKGSILNFDDYEKLFYHNFNNELRIAPDYHPHIFSEALGTTVQEREKLTQIMFDTFSIPAYYTDCDSKYTLYASGRITGIVLESGDETTTSTAIYDGCVLPFTVQHHNVAGKEVTNYLIHLLNESKVYSENTMSTEHIVRDIKEKLCFFDSNIKNRKHFGQSYQLPDGTMINLSNERKSAPELMFQPHLSQIKDTSIIEKINQSIKKSYSFLHQELCLNIVLGGGNTMFEGFSDRLTKELSKLFKNNVRVIALSDRLYSSWIGASIISSLSTFQNFWLSKKDYDENGPQMIEYKSPCTFIFYSKGKTMKDGMYELFKSLKDINTNIYFQ